MLNYLILICLLIAGVPCLAQGSSARVVSDTTILRSALTVSRQNSKVLLHWTELKLRSVGFYSIERKNNDKDFEVVGLLRADSSLLTHEWLDEAPGPGRNAYRIYIVEPDGTKNLLASGLAVFEGEEPIRFYPNPVENVLIIRTTFPAEVMLLDAQGQIKVPAFTVSGLYTLNVSALEKGIYFIRFRNKTTASVTQERLIKK